MTVPFVDRPVAGPASLRKEVDNDESVPFVLDLSYLRAVELTDEALLIVAQTVESAVEGRAASMRQLGQLLEQGLGVEKDVHLAIEWYRDAVEKGDLGSLKAIQRLASSDRVAMRVLKRLAIQQTSFAMASLRALAMQSPALFEEVTLFLKVVADKDRLDAIDSLGRLYEQKDPEIAEVWRRRREVLMEKQQSAMRDSWEIL